MLSLLSSDVGQLDDNQNDQNDPDPYFYLMELFPGGSQEDES